MANYSTHSIGRLGALLSSDTSFNNSSMSIIDIEPQVFYLLGQLNDTLNWVKVEGNFIANGFEEFLTIGYFFANVTNDTTFIEYLAALPGQFVPYYYIDSVTLYEIGQTDNQSCIFQVDFPNVFTPNKDGVNDTISMEKYKSVIEEIIILNRWGNTVAVLNENQPCWNGGNCVDGVYYYIIRFKGYNKKQTGFIHLIR